MFKKSVAHRVVVAMFMALALTFLSVSPIAQARADINYVVTGVSNRRGAATLYFNSFSLKISLNDSK